MSQTETMQNKVAGYLTGAVLATAWYGSTAALLTGLPAQTVPLAGAIVISALTPAFFLRRRKKFAGQQPIVSPAQQLRLLKTHTMVNLVDTNNLLIEVNDLLLDATGYSREELIGKPVSMLYADASAPLADEIRDLLRQGKGWQGQTPLRSRDGTTCITQTTIMPLFDENGAWIGSISARTDITKTTQLLAERDTALTLHELRDDIWIVDEASETIDYMNRAAKRRFGWSDDSYAGTTLTQMAENHECSAIYEACLSLKKSGDSFRRVNIAIGERTFEISINWLHRGTLRSRFLIMLNDLTDRVAQEQQQDDFISMVSHELRSPLTSIKGSMGLLLSKAAGELTPKAEGLLEIAHRNADRLVLIINDILDMEKISSGHMDFEIKEADLSEMVREALRANATAHQRFGLNIKCNGIDTPNMVETDANRIIQVLTNLMSNAAKFSKPGGTVEITVNKVNGGLMVSVRDEGVGISVSDHHKIFQRFADMSNSDRAVKGGTGLGLSICKVIVEGLGGTIDFESREGYGSTFTFTLPGKLRHGGTDIDAPILRNVG